MYCPFIKFDKYADLVRESGVYASDEAVNTYLENIRSQRITSLFYLPSNGIIEDSIVRLDQINNCSLDVTREMDIPGDRLFSLSFYGHYVFLVKLTVHLSRLREGAVRS